MRQGYEASKVNSLKPRKYIHLGSFQLPNPDTHAQTPNEGSRASLSPERRGRMLSPEAQRGRMLPEAPNLMQGLFATETPTPA